MTRKNQQTLIRIVAALLGFVLVVGAISFIGKKTNGFADDITVDALTKKNLNEDNLYTADALTISTFNNGTGIVVKAEDDGVLVLDGKLGGEEGIDVKVSSVDLKAGTYTMSTDASVGLYTAYMYATADDGTTKLIFDFGGNATDGVFEIAADDSYDLYIHIEPDVEFNHVHLYPTIVEGDEVGEFYAK